MAFVITQGWFIGFVRKDQIQPLFRLNVCDDIDECSEGTSNCIDEMELCHNTIGSFICENLIEDLEGGTDCPKGTRFGNWSETILL